MTHFPFNVLVAAPQCGAGEDGRSAMAASLQLFVATSYRAVVRTSLVEKSTPPPAYITPAPVVAIKKDTADFFRAFPDLRFEISNVVEKDDRLGAGEVVMTGTHTGPLVTPSPASRAVSTCSRICV